jgi:hypothetical protein
MRKSMGSYGLMGAALRFGALGLGALALVACNPPHPRPKPPPKTISVLDCPESQGDLNRNSAAADGKTCTYATDAGDQVTLQLISLDGKDPSAVLGPIENGLKAELPTATTGAPPPPSPPGAPSPPPPPGGSDKQRVDIDLPGIHIHGTENGHTNVDTPGAHVDARDGAGHSGDHATVQFGGGALGGVTVNANDGGAQIRVAEKGAGVRSTYILASDTPGPHGYKAAGYEARGPLGGPIVVATILAKSDDHDDIHHDVRDLLTRNVGR